MVAQHKLLVVIDPTTDDQPALQKASEFAEALDADLAIFCCIFNSDFAHAEWVTGDKLDHLRQKAIDEQFAVLEKMTEPLRDKGLRVTQKVAWDRPLNEAIVREAIEIEPDFVFKDTHHHSALSRTLLTNTDWHLIRECPFPLWLVKPDGERKTASVMAAVDPTDEHGQTTLLDQQILGSAQFIADHLHKPLQLVHVFEPPPMLLAGTLPGSAPSAGVDMGTISEQAHQAHADALDRFAREAGITPANVHMKEGDQVELLPEAATELNAEVVVMGAVARSALQRAIIGHTAEKTLETFACDVVIVKSPEFESPVAALPPIYGYSEKSSAN